MTWTEHLVQARRLGGQRAAANLASLLTDHRITGLVQYLDALETGFSASAVDKRLADRHGAMAHAAGATYALRLVREHLSRLMEGRGGAAQPANEEEETGEL